MITIVEVLIQNQRDIFLMVFRKFLGMTYWKC
jgi:hypothetical protein